MTLGSHAIIGAAIGSVLGDKPETALALGWLSHYFFDFVPHREYRLRSLQGDFKNPLNKSLSKGRDFYHDLVMVAIDASLGLLLGIVFFVNLARPEKLTAVLAGALGAMIPDFLQFAYVKLKREPFITLQKIHGWAHSSHRELNEKPLLGFLLQLFIILVAFLVGNWRLFR